MGYDIEGLEDLGSPEEVAKKVASGEIQFQPVVDEAAENAEGLDIIALSDAHMLCIVPEMATLEELRAAAITLLESVEAGQQFLVQVDTGIYIAHERGVLSDAETLRRLHNIGFSALVATDRKAGFDLLCEIAVGDDPTSAKLARVTMLLGPEGGSDDDRVVWRTAAKAAAEGKTFPAIADIVASLI